MEAAMQVVSPSYFKFEHVLQSQVPHTLETMSGNVINFRSMEYVPMPFDEIALAMSRLPVMLGHQLNIGSYTLADHALWMQRYVLWRTGCPHCALYALLYRAHEVYTGIIPDGVKHLSYLHEGIEYVQSNIQSMVYQSVGLAKPPEDVKKLLITADAIASALECEKFLISRNYEAHVTNIPEAAREIAWSDIPQAQIYQELMDTYEILMEVIAPNSEEE